jgi:hypothetical protein
MASGPPLLVDLSAGFLSAGAKPMLERTGGKVYMSIQARFKPLGGKIESYSGGWVGRRGGRKGR